jgi:hypothetical protein
MAARRRHAPLHAPSVWLAPAVGAMDDSGHGQCGGRKWPIVGSFLRGAWSKSPALPASVARSRFTSTKVSAMRHLRRWSMPVAASLLAAVAACNESQRNKTDSAAGAVENNVRTALSVIDVDMGRGVDTERKISDKTDDFAPNDTIYASVHTSGTATSSPVVGRWTFQDGTVVDEKTDNVTTNGDARTVFFIAKPAGLARGKYTLHVLVDGKEVRTKDVEVK